MIQAPDSPGVYSLSGYNSRTRDNEEPLSNRILRLQIESNNNRYEIQVPYESTRFFQLSDGTFAVDNVSQKISRVRFQGVWVDASWETLAAAADHSRPPNQLVQIIQGLLNFELGD